MASCLSKTDQSELSGTGAEKSILTAKSFTGPETLINPPHNLTVKIEISHMISNHRVDMIQRFAVQIAWLFRWQHDSLNAFFSIYKTMTVRRSRKKECQAFHHTKPTVHDETKWVLIPKGFVDQISMSSYLLTGCQIYLWFKFPVPTVLMSPVLRKKEKISVHFAAN